MKEVLEILEIIVKLVQAIAWPVVVAFVALKYRQEFRAILKRLEKAKFGDAEFSLAKEQAEDVVTKSSAKLLNLISPDIESESRYLNRDSEDSKSRNLKQLASVVRTADVDGDGKNELVISNPLGPYNNHVRVFKPIVDFNRLRETTVSFELIGEIRQVNYIVDIKNIDLDKKAIIIVNEDEKSSKPHVLSAKDNVTYKWIAGEFHEIDRKRVRESQDS